MSRTYGNMMRISSAVSSTLPGVLAKPLARRYTSHGAASTPSAEITSSTTASSAPTVPTRSRVASAPRCRLYSARMGTKACEKAPSANRRRRMFGRRNAASKASICSPAPIATALMLSRARPVIRDSSVIALTVDNAFSRFIDGRCDPDWTARREMAQLACGAKVDSACENCEKRLLCPVFFCHSRKPGIFDGQYRASQEARPAVGGDAQAQCEPQVGAAQCSQERQEGDCRRGQGCRDEGVSGAAVSDRPRRGQKGRAQEPRSEEHTSELQSPDHLVCRLLLEK